MRLEDDFTQGLSPEWTVTEAGCGIVDAARGTLRLIDQPTPRGMYTNAQITDYSYRSFKMRWKPPVRVTVTARATVPANQILGTAGFGFWNHPLSPGRSRRIPRLPRAAWFFFASPPSNIALVPGVPGSGWNTMTIDMARKRALALAPFALPVALLNRVAGIRKHLWPPIQKALSISELALDTRLLEQTHTYQLEWREDGVTFAIDGRVVHHTPASPRGPTGFIAWIDNQYAIATPQGNLGWGLLPLEREQGLILERVVVETRSPLSPKAETSMDKPAVVMTGNAAWADVVAQRAHQLYRLTPYTDQQNYVARLADDNAALVLVDGDSGGWRFWVTTPKASSATRRIPVVLVSTSPRTRAEALQAGADMALTPSELVAQLGELLTDLARVVDPDDAIRITESCQEPMPPDGLEAIRRFNDAEYYKQHDLFEALWMKERGPVRDLYRAILQVGIAYYQITRGNQRGALKMLLRSIQWLAVLPDECQGVDIAQLKADAAQVRVELERLGPDRMDEFDHSLLKPVRLVDQQD